MLEPRAVAGLRVVGQRHGLVGGPEGREAVDADGSGAPERLAKADGLQRSHPSRMQQFSAKTGRRTVAGLEERHPQAGLRQRRAGRQPGESGPHDHHILVRDDVHAAPSLPARPFVPQKQMF
jgi:hypothetical protein